MRSSVRYDNKKVMYHSKRGISPKTKSARIKVCRVVVAALLLLIGVFWLTRPTKVPSHGINNGGSENAKVGKEEAGSRKLPSDGINNGGSEITKVWKEEAGSRKLGKKETGDDDGDGGLLIGEANGLELGKNNWSNRRETIEEDGEVGDDEVCNWSKYPAAWELRSDQITILINGFAESRLSLLQTHVKMYSAVPVVHSIYILWGNTSTPPDVLEQWNFDSLGAPIYMVRQDSTSLNDRFLPRNYIKTRAVMICDDDITVDAKSLGFALEVWREDQARIVGFFPRAHAYELQSKSWIYVKEEQRYSIMLTKLMILATEYLYLYTCEMPDGVKEYVDQGNNCEDIAMNFLVSSRSRKGPLLVEGEARDWGDTRNTEAEAEQVRQSALSFRKNHRQNRGSCITAFQKFWNGMELRFSYAKASSDLVNQVHCEKFGYLIDCDKSVASERDARRIVGENVISFSHRYAYATFLSSDQHVNASLLLAQSLRTSGTIHDLVLLVDPLCSSAIMNSSHVLHEHYDKVVRVGISQGADAHGKLSTWLLLAYAKVVYLETDSLVLANLDHLFQLPEPAAAPRVFMPGKFSTGLLVLKPSNETYTRLVQSLERLRTLHSRRRQYLLNSYFNGWFQMPAENRLPARYNVPAVFSKKLTIPNWVDMNRAYDNMGPLMVVRYGNAKLVSKHYDSNSRTSNVWCSARLKLFESLLNNDLHPLENDNISNWAPIRMNSSVQVNDFNWPPQTQLSLVGFDGLPSETSKSRETFVTVLYDSQNPLFSLAGWAESFHHHHSFQSRSKTFLLVLSTLEPKLYKEYLTYFDEVRVVEPILVNGRALEDSFTLLHLWNQTDFDKLVYVASTSLFLENCNSLLDYAPFAAVPSLFPPDTFSTQVMSIQPNQLIYNLFREKLLTYEFPAHPVERFLNGYYSDWYQSSTSHRINPSYSISMVFETHLQNSGLPWKVLSFGLHWLPGEEANVTRLWKKTVCHLKPARKPEILMSLCEAGGVEAV